MFVYLFGLFECEFVTFFLNVNKLFDFRCSKVEQSGLERVIKIPRGFDQEPGGGGGGGYEASYLTRSNGMKLS